MRHNLPMNKILRKEEESDANHNSRITQLEISDVNHNLRITQLETSLYKVQLINKTGSPSVKGTIVSASPNHDLSFILQTIQYDAIGVVYQDGVADGDLCYIIIAGIADVLLENNTASVRGNWVYASTADGRANASLLEPSGGGFTNAQEHFKEIGHCLESKTSGTNVLAKCLIHFN